MGRVGPGLPNGSRLSCGRNSRWRKEAERLIELASEATQFFPTRAPGSFKRLLGGRPSGVRPEAVQ